MSKRLQIIIITIILLLVLLTSIILMWPSKTTTYIYRSSDLEKVEIGDITEYRSNGLLTYAANLHYAKMVTTEAREDGQSVVIEAYFDDNGNPAKQINGHYALRKTYINGLNTSITFLNANLHPIMNLSGYSTRIREFDNGVVVVEWYKDINGNPVATTSGVYGQLNDYENGRNTVITYVDPDGVPKNNKSGYAILKRSFYEEGSWTGKVENEFYYDENDQPIALSLGHYGLHKKYDELGRNNILTYLDADGQPIVTKAGYTTVKRTFYPDDTVRTEMYFDLDGNPVALSQGQYGILKENGNTSFLDAEGKTQFNLRNWLYANPFSVILIALVVVGASTVLGRKCNGILLITYIAFAIYMTLMFRAQSDSRAEFELFWSYKQFISDTSLRLEILNNIWLFVPLGAILYKLWPKAYMLLIPVLLSVLIEVIQYFTGLGLCELDDVISNSLGGALGFGFAYSLEPMVIRICSGFIVFGKSFIHLWVGDDYRASYYVILLLMIPVTIPEIQKIGLEIQKAKNLHQFRSILYAIISIVNVGISIPLSIQFGAIGAATGTAITVLIGNGLIMNIYYQRVVNLDMAFFWNNIIKLIPPVLFSLLIGVIATNLINITSWSMFCPLVVAYSVIYLITIYFVGMNQEEKSIIKKIGIKINKND